MRVNDFRNQYERRENKKQRKNRRLRLVTIAGTSENPYGIVDSKGCYSCHRTGHFARECPYSQKCRQCLQMLEEGKFRYDPNQICSYWDCTAHNVDRLNANA